MKINAPQFYSAIQNIVSLAIKQPKSMFSFLTNIKGMKNTDATLNTTQNLSSAKANFRLSLQPSLTKVKRLAPQPTAEMKAMRLLKSSMPDDSRDTLANKLNIALKERGKNEFTSNSLPRTPLTEKDHQKLFAAFEIAHKKFDTYAAKTKDEALNTLEKKKLGIVNPRALKPLKIKQRAGLEEMTANVTDNADVQQGRKNLGLAPLVKRN